MDSQKKQEMKKQMEERGRTLLEIGIALKGIKARTYGPAENLMSAIAGLSIVVVVLFWIVSILHVFVMSGIYLGYAMIGAVVLPVIAYGIFQMGNWLNRMFGTWEERLGKLLVGYQPICDAEYLELVARSPEGELDLEGFAQWFEDAEMPAYLAQLKGLEVRRTIKLKGIAN